MKNIAKLVRSGALTMVTFTLTYMPVIAQEVVIQKPPRQVDNIGNIISALINLIILIAAILTFAFLVWGGIEWITSGGDKSKYEAARNRITAALVGLVIVAASWALMNLVARFLGIGDWSRFNLPTVNNPTAN